jgi:hypothetical protein
MTSGQVMANLHVVIMFQEAGPTENLSLSGQVNEVFGPFSSGDEAEAWTETAVTIIKGRQWHITPLSDPAVLNSINPLVN